jgi:hypothetical protein
VVLAELAHHLAVAAVVEQVHILALVQRLAASTRVVVLAAHKQ